jgi:hypothetical protein
VDACCENQKQGKEWIGFGQGGVQFVHGAEIKTEWMQEAAPGLLLRFEEQSVEISFACLGASQQIMSKG